MQILRTTLAQCLEITIQSQCQKLAGTGKEETIFVRRLRETLAAVNSGEEIEIFPREVKAQ